MEQFVGGAAVVAVRILHGVYQSLDIDAKLAKETDDRIKRRVVMAMLVHWCYFRDLKPVEEMAAWFLEYDNERAKNYGDKFWESHPCDELDRGELNEYGLAFLRKKECHSNPNAPDLAIVLRGTIPTRKADLMADWRIGIQKFDHTKRVVRISRLILQVVEKFREKHPRKKICMAGHSLGAAIAQVVGGCLFSTHGIDIDTHLFNPPLLTLVDVAAWGLPTPPEDTCDTCRFKVDFSEVKEALVGNKVAVEEEFDRFWNLQDWVPHIYLNPGDPVCRQFIDFYRTVEHPGDVIAPQALLSGLFTNNVDHLQNVVPSADLCISTWRAKPNSLLKKAPRLMKEVITGILSHSLRQWHKYTEDYIGLSEHRARLLDPDSFEFDPTVSPRIPDYSYLSN